MKGAKGDGTWEARMNLETASRVALEENETMQMVELKYLQLPWPELALIPNHWEKVKTELTEPSQWS